MCCHQRPETRSELRRYNGQDEHVDHHRIQDCGQSCLGRVQTRDKGIILTLRKHLKMYEDMFGCHEWGYLVKRGLGCC